MTLAEQASADIQAGGGQVDDRNALPLSLAEQAKLDVENGRKGLPPPKLSVVPSPPVRPILKGAQATDTSFSGNATDTQTMHPLDDLWGLVEGPLAAASGAVTGVGSGLVGIASLPWGTDKAAENVKKVQSFSYEPKTQMGQNINYVLGLPGQGLNYLGDIAGGKLADVGLPGAGAIVAGAPSAAAAALGARSAFGKKQGIPPAETPRMEPTIDGRPPVAAESLEPVGTTQATQTAQTSPAQFGSVGASGTTSSAAALAQGASPELRAALSEANKRGNLNSQVAMRHVEADTLPVPIKLKPGQATRDPSLWADEWNKRTDDAAFNARQNQNLVKNVDAVEDNARPDIHTANALEDGAAAIRAYKAYDAPKVANIDALYEKMRAANGGEFPIDGKTFAANARASLKHGEDFLPAQFSKILDQYASGERGMDFGSFETLRTQLANASRLAERAGDGNAGHAISLMRQSLEDLPLSGTAAEAVKPLADAARKAARERFQEIKNDPAYKAALDDVAPDNFTQKYIINGKARDVASMRQKFSSIEDMPEAPQILSAAGLRYIKEGAIKGVQGEERWAGQTAFNKRLDALRSKGGLLFDSGTLNKLDQLGRVASYIESPPPGAVLNTSGTASVLRQWAQSTGGGLVSVAEAGLNAKTGGIPIATGVRKLVEGVTSARDAKKRTAPYQGLNYQPQSGEVPLSDFIKEPK